jgi:uncharacterized repeat protein (TIGR03806 family)
LFLVAYSGEILELEPRESGGASAAEFPRRLSETGLFTSTADLAPAPGLIPYSVNAPVWADGARMERFLAIPDEGRIGYQDSRGWNLPERSVLVQTLFLEMEAGIPASARRIETRILTRQDGEWAGYSYLWDDDQKDAVLVESHGVERVLAIKDAGSPGGKRRQTWHVPARTECMGCHSRAANWLLGVSTLQMNRDHNYGGEVENQIAAFERVGIFEKSPAKPATESPRLVDPYDPGADLTARARSYLHANCSHCHVVAGGGNARLELEFQTADEKTMLFADPLHTTFGLPEGKVVSRGEPCRSVLLYRVSKLGHGRMPHLGSSVVDVQATKFLFDWVAALPAAAGATCSEATANRIAGHRLELENLRSGRTVGEVCDRLFTGVDGAMLLLNEVSRNRLPAEIAAEAIRRGASHADAAIRDLFERFLPEEERLPRLGANFDPRVVLEHPGDAKRGEELFFSAAGMQCKSCHAVKGRGPAVGPDLGDVGKKQTRDQILQSLLEPSKVIDEKYRTWVVETTAGRVYTGLLMEKSPQQIVLRDAQNQVIRVPMEEVELFAVQSVSLMPTMLLRDLSPQQAADLLEFLISLK